MKLAISVAVLMIAFQIYLYKLYVKHQPKFELSYGLLVDKYEVEDETPVYDANGYIAYYNYSTSYYCKYDVNGTIEKMSVNEAKYDEAEIGTTYSFPCKKYREYYEGWTFITVLFVFLDVLICVWVYHNIYNL